MLKFTKSELTELAATIHGFLLAGDDETTIMERMRLDAETFNEAKRHLLETKSQAIKAMPNEHVYMEYVIEQRRNIKSLNDLITNLDDKKQYNALVGAIRLRSEILDRIVAKGQEFGVMFKRAERKEVVGGLLVADMSSDDLRKAIGAQVKMLGEFVGKWGEKSFLDTPDAPIHFDAEAEGEGMEDDEELLEILKKRRVSSDAPAPKTARAKSSKRHAGRSKAGTRYVTRNGR